jgi:hypothetical protein
MKASGGEARNLGLPALYSVDRLYPSIGNYAGYLRVKTPHLIIVGLMAASLGLIGKAGGDGGKTNLNVECRCADAVGGEFCSEFKSRVTASPGYDLAANNNGYGIGIHFSCVDLWQGIDNQLAGRMSAVSVAFTIYSQKLPGEVYEDSSVFRVGKDATAEMSRKIIAAIGQLVTANAPFFEQMRKAAATPSPSPSP